MKNSTTVQRQVILLAGAMLAVLAAYGGVSLYSHSSIDGALATLTADAMPGLLLMGETTNDIYLHRGDTWRHVASSDPGEMSRIEAELQKRIDDAEAGLAKYDKTINLEVDRKNFDRLRTLMKNYEDRWESLVPESRKGQSAELVQRYNQTVGAAFDELATHLERMTQWNYEHAGKATTLASATTDRARLCAWLLLAAGLLGGAGLSWLVIRRLNGVLLGVVNDLAQGAGQVSAAAGQVASASQSLARGASDQAASLEQTSAASEEISSMVRKNGANSAEAARLAAQSRQRFEETKGSLGEMVTAIGEIQTHGDKISRIIKVIEEIAFQTNILALNAAVEAARAGAAGMGFAVVADEVRNLAQRSSQAAKDTSGLIGESIARSREGKAKVDVVAQAIGAVAGDVERMSTLMEDVSVGGSEQTRGVEQVAQALTRMEQLTQGTASDAEESAAAAEELSAQSSAVMEAVDRLRALVGARARG